MRTVIDINDDVLQKAMRLTGISKKVDIVNLALTELVRQREIEDILTLSGQITWDGDLDKMREDRLDSH